MGTNKRKTNKFGITPSIIFLNLTIVIAVCAICFLAYNVMKGDVNENSSEPPFTAVTSEPEQTTAQTTDTSAAEPVSSSKPDTQSSSPESVNSEESTPPTVFDAEFFDNSLFIGDSITTGLYLYGFLDSANVFAEQGLAPSTALNAEIDGKTLEAKIAVVKPEKIYIMLGTNSVGYGDAEDLSASMQELVNRISGLCTAKIYVLSIPPVTKEAELSDDNYLSVAAVTEYNTLLKKSIGETKARFIDFYSVLADSDGYFNADYAEADGIHFMGTTYQVMLSFLEKETA